MKGNLARLLLLLETFNHHPEAQTSFPVHSEAPETADRHLKNQGFFCASGLTLTSFNLQWGSRQKTDRDLRAIFGYSPSPHLSATARLFGTSSVSVSSFASTFLEHTRFSFSHLLVSSHPLIPTTFKRTSGGMMFVPSSICELESHCKLDHDTVAYVSDGLVGMGEVGPLVFPLSNQGKKWGMAKRILIVDDEEDIVQLVRLILEDAGYQVGTTTDSRSVVPRLVKERFDLVLLDIMMPFYSGWQILRQLREHPSTRGLPVAMLTARASPHEDFDSYPTDYCDYIVKPFEPDDLVRRVGRILSV